MSMIALALAAALSQSDPAAANEADLRCVAVVLSIIGEHDPQGDQKAGLVGGAMFFIGRIDGRDPNYDLRAGLLRLAARPDADAVITADRVRCANLMIASGEKLVDAGEALVAAGR